MQKIITSIMILRIFIKSKAKEKKIAAISETKQKYAIINCTKW